MPQQEGTNAAGPVHAKTQGRPQLRVVEGRTGDVEADILHHRGGDVRIAAAAVDVGGVGAGQVAYQHLDVVGIEGVGHGVGVLAGGQLDALQRHGLILPPVRSPGQIHPALVLGIAVGAAAHRYRVPLGAALDDRNVQSGGELRVVAGEVDAEGTLPQIGHGVHLRQPLAVPHGLLGPPQGSHHVPRRQGRAVREGDAGAHGDGQGVAFGVIGGALRQTRLGQKVGTQRVQTLIQQRTQCLLGAVGAGDGVPCLSLQIGQAEGGETGILLGAVALLIVLGEGVVGLLRLLAPVAAGQRHKTRRRQQKG